MRNNPQTLTMRDGLAWKGGKLYVPQSLRLKVLNRGHDVKPAGHFGSLNYLKGVRDHNNQVNG
ncbi:Tf2-1: Tf2-1 [Crotalus adamanteus]|uniref:Tf2-1: Tf2-1 n=1 Tax=Crotalus adamanteus TaxID=8729 RepID=A0AAW1BBP2_CROAD